MRLLTLLSLPWLVRASLDQPDTEVASDQYAWITPLINVSDPCSASSKRYKDAVDSGELWGSTILDSDGRLPLEGFLSDSVAIPVNLCDLINADGIQNLPGCENLPPSLTNINLNLLVGFSSNPGSMDICLDQKAPEFPTKYCSVDLKVGGGRQSGPPRGVLGEQGYPDGRYLGGGETYFGRIARVLETGEAWRRWRESGRGLEDRENITGFPQFHKHVLHLYTLVPQATAMKYEQVIKYFHLNPGLQLLGTFLSLWAEPNAPTIGMCFPAQCGTDDINGQCVAIANIA